MLKYLFESLLPLVADSVLVLRCYAPSTLLASLQVWVSRLRAVPFLALLLWFLIFFFSSFPFPLSIRTSFVSSCLSFSCGYDDAASLVMVSAVTRLFSIWYAFIWYARTLISRFYFCRRYPYTISFSYCVPSVFVCFPPVRKSSIIGDCPVTRWTRTALLYK